MKKFNKIEFRFVVSRFCKRLIDKVNPFWNLNAGRASRFCRVKTDGKIDGKIGAEIEQSKNLFIQDAFARALLSSLHIL